MLLLWILEKKYVKGNILLGLLVLFWHCNPRRENAFIKVVDPASWPADRVSLDQQVMTTWAKGWSVQWLWNGLSLCSTVEVAFSVFLQVVSSSPTPCLPSPRCLLWLQPWTQPPEERKIIRREDCAWHYFWKAGYYNESRAGIHCVWGGDWKPLVSFFFWGGCGSPGRENRAFPSPLMHAGERREAEAEVSSTMAGAEG